MSNASSHKFGDVQDYSIKMSMNNDANRGFTWGANGLTPTASLSIAGNYTTKGWVNAQGGFKVNGTQGGIYVPFNGRVAITSWLNTKKVNGTYTIDFSNQIPASAHAVAVVLEFKNAGIAVYGDTPKYGGYCALQSYTTDAAAYDNYMVIAKQYIAARWGTAHGIVTVDNGLAKVYMQSLNNGSGMVSVFAVGYYI